MTFLSPTSDALYADIAAQVPSSGHTPSRAASRPLPAPLVAHGLAIMVVAATLMVPGGVAQAKWTKMHLIFDQVEHRCMASFTI